MASAHGTITIRIADLPQTKLLFWQLEELRSEMVLLSQNDFADKLDAIIKRFHKPRKEVNPDVT